MLQTSRVGRSTLTTTFPVPGARWWTSAVEIEADSVEQVASFLALDGIDYILLDNMSPEQLLEAVSLRGESGKPQLEASGGVTLETVREIATTGVDLISVGALTHSAPALDIGLDFEWLS